MKIVYLSKAPLQKKESGGHHFPIKDKEPRKDSTLQGALNRD